MLGYFILRLSIWFLLTANFSWANLLIGVSLALLLPPHPTTPERLKDLLQSLGQILTAIPQAYKEALEMMLRPHTQEEIVMERVRAGRSPGLIFLDIFLITFTPKTTVLRYDDEGWYEVHHVYWRKQP
jgi:multicomponent Na+:H+ antiporter subunit E